MREIHLHDSNSPLSDITPESMVALVADIIDGDIIDERVKILVNQIRLVDENVFSGSIIGNIKVGIDSHVLLKKDERIIFERRHASRPFGNGLAEYALEIPSEVRDNTSRIIRELSRGLRAYEDRELPFQTRPITMSGTATSGTLTSWYPTISSSLIRGDDRYDDEMLRQMIERSMRRSRP